MSRDELADEIAQRLLDNQKQLRKSWLNSGSIPHCFLDDLLPDQIATQIRAAYPRSEAMKLKKSLRELKFRLFA